jgi:hypothetical protein
MAKAVKTTRPSKLNMIIARTHRLSQRLIGIQMTTGTLVGIGLSACQISAGFLVIGWWFINGNALMVGLVIVIGCALATLIERLSLGGLGGTRVMLGDLQEARDTFYARLRKENRAATESEKTELAQKETSLKRKVGVSITFSVVGMVLSFGLGDIFWHQLFEKAGWVGWVLSSSCAIVISLTFIHSELFKPLMDRLLQEILRDLHLMKVAVAAEGQSMQVELMAAAFDAVRDSEEVRKPAQAKVERTVVKSLSSAADEYAAIEGQVTIYEDKALPGGQLRALPAPKGKYMQNRDQLRRLVMSNPQLSQRDVASQFSISRSTAGEWLKKIKAGN